MPPSLETSASLTSSVPKALLEEITGCKVLSYEVENATNPGDNYLSILYSVSAEVVPSGGGNSAETRHYLLKCYPTHPGRQAFLNKTNVFHNELCFYKIWAKELVSFQLDVIGNPRDKLITPAFPPCVGGKAVDFVGADADAYTKVYDPMENFVMMTDLRKSWGYRMADKRHGLQLDHISLAFTELANIHALSWAYKNRVEMDVTTKYPFLISRYDKDDIEMYARILDGNIGSAMASFDSVLGENNYLTKSTKEFHQNALKIINFFVYQKLEDERNFWNLHRDPPKDLVEATENEEPWRIICHGDSWCNNFLFKNDAAGKPESIMLVDFQFTREACPTVDLVYTIFTSTTAEFRKAHLDQVLQLYCDKFLEACKTLKVEPLPGFSFDSLKRRLHRSKLYGYMLAVIALALMMVEKGKGVNLEEMNSEASMESMFVESFGKGSGSAEYVKRITDIAQEMYDDGVI